MREAEGRSEKKFEAREQKLEGWQRAKNDLKGLLIKSAL